jgi:hypothetical protein
MSEAAKRALIQFTEREQRQRRTVIEYQYPSIAHPTSRYDTSLLTTLLSAAMEQFFTPARRLQMNGNQVPGLTILSITLVALTLTAGGRVPELRLGLGSFALSRGCAEQMYGSQATCLL